MMDVTQAIPPAHSFTYEGAVMNIYHADKGQGLPKHDHIYSHATFCMSGSCIVRKEGKEVIVDKFTQPINLVANEWHEIEALEDGTVFCNVFSEAHQV
jgi:quercetin dioxygenase-like cupin family protein